MAAVKPIRTDEDLDRTLARIDAIFDTEENTPESAELDILVDLVEHYESKRHPVDYPSAVAAIEFRLDQAGLTQEDLVPLIGGPSEVSDVLSGKRAITMSTARALHEHLGIPVAVLLQQPTAPPESPPTDHISTHIDPEDGGAGRSKADATPRARIERGNWPSTTTWRPTATL